VSLEEPSEDESLEPSPAEDDVSLWSSAVVPSEDESPAELSDVEPSAVEPSDAEPSDEDESLVELSDVSPAEDDVSVGSLAVVPSEDVHVVESAVPSEVELSLVEPSEDESVEDESVEDESPEDESVEDASHASESDVVAGRLSGLTWLGSASAAAI